jgi:hypothetical protein
MASLQEKRRQLEERRKKAESRRQVRRQPSMLNAYAFLVAEQLDQY